MTSARLALTRTIPTVSPLTIPLVYCHINSFQQAFSVERPLPGGEIGEAGGQRITRNCEAIGSFLLTCATTGLSLITV
jgi:hypothetical protein